MHLCQERRQEKRQEEERRKWIKAKRVTLSTLTQAIDVFIGDEEQNGKQKKETGNRPPSQLLWTIWSPLITHMDHIVGLF